MNVVLEYKKVKNALSSKSRSKLHLLFSPGRILAIVSCDAANHSTMSHIETTHVEEKLAFCATCGTRNER